jgi:hypothetical protein
MSWKVYLENMLRFGRKGYRMHVIRDNFDQSFDVLLNPTFHHYEPHSGFSEGEFFMSDELPGNDTRGFLQAMSDAAWEIGIKPKQLEGHTDELKAVRYHLEDMRQLAGVKK